MILLFWGGAGATPPAAPAGAGGRRRRTERVVVHTNRGRYLVEVPAGWRPWPKEAQPKALGAEPAVVALAPTPQASEAKARKPEQAAYDESELVVLALILAEVI